MKKKLIAILLAMATLISCVGMLTGCQNTISVSSITKDPAGQLKKSIEITKETLRSGMILDPTEYVKETFQNGSLAINLQNSNGKDNSNNTLYFQKDTKAFALIGSLTEYGETQEYNLWVKDKEFAVSAPNVLDKTYGIHLGTIKEDLKDSALLEALGISYEEAVEAIDAILKMEPTEKEAEDSDWRTMLKMLNQAKELVQSSPVTVTEYTTNNNGSTEPGFRITYTMDAKRMQQLVDLAATWYQTTEAYKTMISNEGAEEDFKQAIVEAKKFLETTNTVCVLDVCLNEKGVIVWSNIRADWLENEKASYITATLNLGVDPVNATLYSFEVIANSQGKEVERTTIKYHRSSAHNLPGRKLTIKTGSEQEVTVFDLNYNITNNQFSLRMDGIDGEMIGTLAQTEDTMTISLNIPSDGSDSGTITFIFTKKAQMPDMPAYTNLCTLTEEQLQMLFGSMIEMPDDSIYAEQSN